MEQDEVTKIYSFLKSCISYRKPKTASTGQRDTAKRCSMASAENDSIEYKQFNKSELAVMRII